MQEPTDEERLLAWATTLVETGRTDEAASVLGNLVVSNPESARGHRLLSCVHSRENRFREALAAAETSIRLDPDEEEGHRFRAFALLGLRQRRAALEAARRAVALAPDEAYPYMALAAAELANRRRGEALAAARTACQLDPSNADTHTTFGQLAFHTNRPADAERHFRDALAIAPEDPDALNGLGLALERQGRSDEAVTWFAAASVANPRDSGPRRRAMRIARNLAGLVAIALTVGVVQLFVGYADRVPGWLVWTVLPAILVALLTPDVLKWHRTRRRAAVDPEFRREVETAKANRLRGRELRKHMAKEWLPTPRWARRWRRR